MKAIGLYKYLGTDDKNCLIEEDIETPVASGCDLLIKVKAISVNPVDTKIRASKDTNDNSLTVLGWDASGEVMAVGEKCSRFTVGDEVYYAGSVTRPGANSELHLVDERIVGHKPKSLSHAESAAMPLTTITAWESLHERMNIDIEPSERNQSASLLIISGAGGVGSIATQLAKKSGIGKIIATASRPETIEFCKKMGADETINHREPLQPQLEKLGISQVDYIFCCYAPENYFDSMVDIIKPQGSICGIVDTENDTPLLMNKLKNKSVRFCWEFMFTRSMFETEDVSVQHDILNQAADLFDQKVLFTTLTENLGAINAKNLIQAHKQLESGKTIGKIALEGF